MSFIEPLTLSAHGVILRPLSLDDEDGLRAAAADGELWSLRYASVPDPEQTRRYILDALAMRDAGHRFPFVVIDSSSGHILGSTSYHDIVPAIPRVEIGWTWYARRAQRTHVNTACKLLLLTHAFETLGCHAVGWRTDILNTTSQRAIERLGAHKDGIIRGHALRRDGTVRDTVMYSMLHSEWPRAKARLLQRLANGGTPNPGANAAT